MWKVVTFAVAFSALIVTIQAQGDVLYLLQILASQPSINLRRLSS